MSTVWIFSRKKKSIQYRNLQNIKDIDEKNKNSIKKSSERTKHNKNSKNITESFSFNKVENSLMKTNNNFITNIEDNKENNDLNNKNNTKTDIRKEKEHLKDFSFWNYICYVVTLREKNRFFNIYRNFRIKIMSEEHLIRNHLNIFNLLKVMDKKRHLRRNSYNLKDLIKTL